MIFALLQFALELKSISSSSSCKDNLNIACKIYLISSSFVHPADDIVECAGKLEKAGWHLPTEQSQPVLVSQYAFAIEPVDQQHQQQQQQQYPFKVL